MLRHVKTAVVSVMFLGGMVGIAYAQGYATQDPGSHAPRNLTLQYLGPSDPGPTIPGGPGTSGTPLLRLPSGRGANSAIPGYGSGAAGAASGNSGGYGTSRLGGNR
jgi:hypothetical protein